MRLLPNGVVDLSFDPGFGADAVILALRLDSLGTLHLGGWFTNFAEFPRRGVARLHTEHRLAQPVVHDGWFSVRTRTADGWSYILERAEDLAESPWVTITNVPGNGRIQTMTDGPESRWRGFYRLRME